MFDKIGTSQWYLMLSLVIARKQNKGVVAEKASQGNTEHILLALIFRTKL